MRARTFTGMVRQERGTTICIEPANPHRPSWHAVRTRPGQGNVPVTMEKTPEKISMTVPVTMESNAGSGYRLHFVMPSKYTMQTLPKPADPRVSLREMPARRMAAIRFYKFSTEATIAAAELAGAARHQSDGKAPVCPLRPAVCSAAAAAQRDIDRGGVGTGQLAPDFAPKHARHSGQVRPAAARPQSPVTVAAIGAPNCCASHPIAKKPSGATPMHMVSSPRASGRRSAGAAA